MIELLELMLVLALGFVAGCAWASYRLKGDRTWRETGAVILGGGGPGQEQK